MGNGYLKTLCFVKNTQEFSKNIHENVKTVKVTLRLFRSIAPLVFSAVIYHEDCLCYCLCTFDRLCDVHEPLSANERKSWNVGG